MDLPALRYDVNCSMLFPELPLLERPAAARAAGFAAVEFWWPVASPVPRDAPRRRRSCAPCATRAWPW